MNKTAQGAPYSKGVKGSSSQMSRLGTAPLGVNRSRKLHLRCPGWNPGMRWAAFEVVRVAWMLESEAGPAGQRKFCVVRQRVQHFQRKGISSLFLPYLKTLRTGGGVCVTRRRAHSSNQRHEAPCTPRLLSSQVSSGFCGGH